MTCAFFIFDNAVLPRPATIDHGNPFNVSRKLPGQGREVRAGATSNTIFVQRGSAPCRSSTASWPVQVARYARSFSFAARTSPRHLRVIVDLPFEIGRLEGRMPIRLALIMTPAAHRFDTWRKVHLGCRP